MSTKRQPLKSQSSGSLSFPGNSRAHDPSAYSLPPMGTQHKGASSSRALAYPATSKAHVAGSIAGARSPRTQAMVGANRSAPSVTKGIGKGNRATY